MNDLSTLEQLASANIDARTAVFLVIVLALVAFDLRRRRRR